MKSNRRSVAGNHTRTSRKDAHKSAKRILERSRDFCAFLWLTQVAGEQMRHGLKPCDTASDPVENPTRFLVEMRSTQSQLST